MPATLREALIELKLIDAADLTALLAWAPYKGLGLAERLYRSGLIPDADLVSAFAALGATDGTPLVVGPLPPPAALGAFTRSLADRHRALPLAIEKRRLVVALLDPSDTDTLEKLTFTCGLIIEPRACRPRALFEALNRAYDIQVVRPDGTFLEARRSSARSANGGATGVVDTGDHAGVDLPPPSVDALVRSFVRMRHPAADVASSPIASALSEAADGIDIDINDSQPPLQKSLLEQRARDVRPALTADVRERDLRPARTPLLDPMALSMLRAHPPSDLVAARDSLPPQVLRLLVPPLRTCALFLVRKNVAVGWDVKSIRTIGVSESGQTIDDDGVSTERIRDVLLPLSAASVLAEAVNVRRAALGNPRDPTTMERTLFRFLRLPPPRAFAALPVLAGDDVIAVLYIDRDGPIDDGLVDEVRRAGAALGDALAPLAAMGDLFPARPMPPVELHES